MSIKSSEPQVMPRSVPLSRLLGHVAMLVAQVQDGASLASALPRISEVASLTTAERGAVQSLTFTALRNLGRGRALRAKLVAKTPKPAQLCALLDVALALMSQSEPAAGTAYAEHTWVNEAVRACKSDIHLTHAAALVNAVLRRYLREREALQAVLHGNEEARWNHPQWWINRLRTAYPAQWQALLNANNAAPPMTLRVNRRFSSRDAYAALLAQHGIEVITLAGFGDAALMLREPMPVERLPAFADGAVSVQDAAAQLAAGLLDAKPGMRVLDACAAPGGKTAHVLELADCDVTALDADAARLARVHDNLHRLKLHARVLHGDATQPADWWDGQLFDRILLDAPCSASGVVRRHPDIRWLRRDADIPGLVRTQAKMLNALWPLLKPGGRLLYCTCSVFPDEGEQQTTAFLQRQPQVRRIELNLSHNQIFSGAFSGQVLPALEGISNNTRPADATHDGFYYALFEKDQQSGNPP
jgi:16S rRNA (cytosine967-C5)-methyltransferase